LLTSLFIELPISFRDSWCEADFSTPIQIEPSRPANLQNLVSDYASTPLGNTHSHYHQPDPNPHY
jgi:hypothetical protein